MAYCRWGDDSDLYMYRDISGGYAFHFAVIPYHSESPIPRTENLSFNVATIEEALHHIKRIKTQGYKVPDYAIERLEREFLKEYPDGER